jgi:hypothetical protein
MSETVVMTYKNENDMKKDIRNKERKGWKTMNVQRSGQGWGVAKTVALGAIFLPLAIFGKKGDLFTVTYQKE